MTPIEQLLSDTADAFEAGLTPDVVADTDALLAQGNSPGLARPLSGLPGASISIVVVLTHKGAPSPAL